VGEKYPATSGGFSSGHPGFWPGLVFQPFRNLGGSTRNQQIAPQKWNLAKDVQSIGQDLYLIIANVVINREMTELERLWPPAKKDGQAKLLQVAAIADHPLERASVEQAQEAYDLIVHIFEQEMLPLIIEGAQVPGGPLADVDARIDKQIDIIRVALDKFAQSNSDENDAATIEFRFFLENSIRIGLAISIIGIAIAVSISALTALGIHKPISELTLAAREMQKGNYAIELRHQSDDEAGVLASAFRSMAEQVKRRTVDLQKSKEQLENEICECKPLP